MPRSLKKGYYVNPGLLRKVRKARETNSRSIIKVYDRSSTIIPEMEGLTLGVYNGRQFVPVLITPERIMHKLGEFALTRLFRSHSGDKKTKG